MTEIQSRTLKAFKEAYCSNCNVDSDVMFTQLLNTKVLNSKNNYKVLVTRSKAIEIRDYIIESGVTNSSIGVE
jgi:hypothetical protein